MSRCFRILQVAGPKHYMNETEHTTASSCNKQNYESRIVRYWLCFGTIRGGNIFGQYGPLVWACSH